jgi:hypothetical protein
MPESAATKVAGRSSIYSKTCFPADHRPKTGSMLGCYPFATVVLLRSHQRSARKAMLGAVGMKDVVGRIRTKDNNVLIIGATLTSAPCKPDHRIPWSFYQRAKTGGRAIVNISQSLDRGAFFGGTSSHPDQHAPKGGGADLWKSTVIAE